VNKGKENMVDYLGWAATAVFAGSYFCTSSDALRRMQMTGAVMWMAYAVVVHAAPVFVANLLVLCAAAWTATRSARRRASRPIDEGRHVGEAA
jgi:hypothetical protein